MCLERFHDATTKASNAIHLRTTVAGPGMIPLALIIATNETLCRSIHAPVIVATAGLPGSAAPDDNDGDDVSQAEDYVGSGDDESDDADDEASKPDNCSKRRRSTPGKFDAVVCFEIYTHIHRQRNASMNVYMRL
jgi:hypothetical protein